MRMHNILSSARSRTGSKSQTRSLRMEWLEPKLTLDGWAGFQAPDPMGNLVTTWVRTYGPTVNMDFNTRSDGVDQVVVNGTTYVAPYHLEYLITAARNDQNLPNRINAERFDTTIGIYAGFGDDVVDTSRTATTYVVGESGNDTINVHGPAFVWAGDGSDVVMVDANAPGQAVIDLGCFWVDRATVRAKDVVIQDNQPASPNIVTIIPEVPVQPTFPSGWSFTGGNLVVDASTVQNAQPHVISSTVLEVTWDSRSERFEGLTSVEWTGTSGADRYSFRGLGFGVTVHGGDGDDEIIGTDYADQLYGDGGNDLLVGLNGADRLVGGVGDDVLDALTDRSDNVSHILDAQDGVASNDTLRFKAVDSVLRDPGGGTDVQVIDSWNDQTGVATIQGSHVRLVEVTYVGVEGIFYDLYITDGSGNEVKRPGTRRANGIVGITVVDTVSNAEIAEPLRTELTSNNWLVINTVPGGVIQDPLRG